MPQLDYRLPEFDAALAALPATPTGNIAGDEPYWSAVRALYRQSDALVNLENGFWGAMAEPVKAMFLHWTERVNFETTLLVRQHWPQIMDGVRAKVAQAMGCGIDEIELTRNATEALLALVSGYNRLEPGDTVLYSDLDYPCGRDAMEWLRERRGVTPVRLTIPEPATRENVLDTYTAALRAHPRTRLVLLSHVCFATGLVMPVRDIAAMAEAAGAGVIVDAAHSWGMLDFDVPDLGAPFAALNLHKWIGAPLGCGAVYIRRGSLDAIDPYLGDRTWPASDIRSRVHTGSPNFAAWLTVPAALDLHGKIGARAKEARLRALRNAWAEPARALPGVQIMTPADPSMTAGITSFRLHGRTSKADNERIVAALRERFGVFTVARPGPDAGEVVRVTPGIFTRMQDVERLLEGLSVLAREG
ncbi:MULTISPECIES: aminotransferase class V-fold PLP-dependent enzyme [unclassified Caballeronia]|uniref:aminotransferase class V-fold PLP-dependent enzyme n=1 Tax=unclassified Caballeronia TaxID=2646786 RepID=UPI002857388E|nr:MULTISPECIES: aminotransferase class V-fold PLP-dependent enzyme [unclassified Caballeronia]MDR5753153.1 aminotransferase class V-fold PLP-dependent enzyme [Caballeronia sp. LZ024]MDR5840892.1 aminotransferase class V-fold PLP-dependent enzyme [Caballeronia sp. LZ031]